MSQSMISSAASSQSPEEILHFIGQEARAASQELVRAKDAQITACLHKLADLLIAKSDDIIEANQKDVQSAKDKGQTDALVDRLTLTPDRIEAIAQGVRAIAALDDPSGKTLWETERPNGLKIARVSVPIGVLGMIYESRPNVTIDAAALCLKSHNAVILRGGSESFESSRLLHSLIQQALVESDLPQAAVSMIPSTDRAFVGAMLAAHDVIDVMIPRGGASLTGRVMEEAKMPVFAHLDGICHVYVHGDAQADMARDVLINAKMRRTGICGAAETLLLDRALPHNVATDLIADLLDAGCAIVGDRDAQRLHEAILPANDDDWRAEYLAPKISVAYVDGVEAAIAHINHYGSHHTDSILCSDASAAERFMIGVDSGIVMHNASTQFADGGEFGMGAEIGIATGKMHARGPVGLEQLCTYKYRVYGQGQTRPQ